ncbi:unnamed protein product [Closterium sp. NIES-53]
MVTRDRGVLAVRILFPLGAPHSSSPYASLHSTTRHRPTPPHNLPLYPPPLLSPYLPLPLSLSPPPLSTLSPSFPPPLFSPPNGAPADYSAVIPPPLITPINGSAADYLAPIPPPLIYPLNGSAADYLVPIPPPLITPLNGSATHYVAPIPPPLISPLNDSTADYLAPIPPLLSPHNCSIAIPYPRCGLFSLLPLFFRASALTLLPSYLLSYPCLPYSPLPSLPLPPLAPLLPAAGPPLFFTPLLGFRCPISVATYNILGASPLMDPRFVVPFSPPLQSTASHSPSPTDAAISLAELGNSQPSVTLSSDSASMIQLTENHVPLTECAHFGQHWTAQELYDAVVSRYSSPATAALGRLLLPYLYPDLSSFATVKDLVSHLRASDARYCAAIPAEFLDKNHPPMFITLYFIVTRLPDSLRSVRDHFLSLDPTSLTVALLEQHLLAAETSAVAVAPAAAAADVSVAEDVGAACPVSTTLGVLSLMTTSSSLAGQICVSPGLLSFDLYFDAILSAMYALSASAEGDCYRCEPPDPGIATTALGASESGTLPGTAPTGALHTFTLDSGAWRCFFRDSTTLTPLPAPVSVRQADPSGWTGSGPLLHCPPVSSDSVRFTIRPSPPLVLYELGEYRYPPGCDGHYHHSWGSGSCLLLMSPPVAPDSSVAPPPGSPLLATPSWHARSSSGLWSTQVSASPAALACPALPSLRRGAAARRSSLLLVSPDDCSLADSPHGRDLPVLRLHSNRGGEFSSDLLQYFCRGEGILQSFTLPDSPQQNGIAERRIGLVMEVTSTTMMHAAAPHFLWPFAVRYAAHQLNLWPRVSLPETSPTLRWTGEVGDASVRFPFYRLFPYRSAPSPPPPLFLAPGPPPVDPLPPQGRAPSRVSQVDPLPGPAPIQVAVGSGAPRGAASGGAASGGAEHGSAESEGAETGGADPRGVASGGGEPGGAEPEGAKPGGAASEGAEFGGVEHQGAASSRGSAGASSRLSLQQLREWFDRRKRLRSGASRAGGAGAARAGGTGVAAGAGVSGGTATTGPRGARTWGTAAAGTGGVEGAGAGDLTESGATGAGAAGAEGAGVGGPGARGAGVGGLGVGGAGAGGAGTVDLGGSVRPRAYFVPLLQQVLGSPPSAALTPPLLCPPPHQSQPSLQPASPLPAPSPYTEQSGGLTERCEHAFRPVLLVRTARRVPHSRPPLVPGMHAMTLRPSSVPLRVPLPAPRESSPSEVPDPESDRARAANPTVSRLLATAVTDPSFDPPSVGGECALGTDVLEDRQEEFECLAVPCFTSMLLAPEGDPDAPDIPTPRSYAEAITGPYSSQWQAAMDAKMASWKSSGIYVNEVPPHGANIVIGMWIFRVKWPPGSPPAFKARYVARGFSQRQGVDYFQTFSPTPKMTTLRWSLRWPVYGLRQAPREWHDTLRTTLAALGFAPATADPSLFLCTNTSLLPFYALLYVDDLVFATADTKALTLVKSELQKRHTCTDMGELRSYLGLQITRDRARRTITLIQSHMVHQVLQRFGFQFSSSQPTSLSTSHSLSAPPSGESVEPSGPYPELVGCLITSGTRLVLGGRGPVVLTGHADASRVDDSATSSCEAEIYGGAMAAQELRWLTYLLTDLGEQPSSPPVLYVDNNAMIALCQEHRLEHRTKHIALQYFLARELQQRGQLHLAYVATRANSADIFAKALSPGDDQHFSTVLGLVPTLPHLLTA